jgi:hypothetical protein
MLYMSSVMKSACLCDQAAWSMLMAIFCFIIVRGGYFLHLLAIGSSTLINMRLQPSLEEQHASERALQHSTTKKFGRTPVPQPLQFLVGTAVPTKRYHEELQAVMAAVTCCC